jgi:uncharacterized membrane protein
LAGGVAGVGILHFVSPRPFERIVPRAMGHAPLLVQVSGVAELVGAGLLAHPRTRRLGGWWLAGVFVAVFPANVQMALDGGLQGQGWPASSPVFAWLRLPLQIPLVVWAVAEARKGIAGRHAGYTPNH